MAGTTARVARPRGLTHLGRIERWPVAVPADAPPTKRSLSAKLLRWGIVAVLVGIGLSVAWFLTVRVTGTAVVEGKVMTFTAPAPVLVQEVYVKAGQWCEKDEPLARLVATEAGSGRAVLECALAQARLRLELVRCGGVLGDWQLAKRLDERDDLVTRIEAASAEVTSTQAKLDRAQREHAISSALEKRGQASSRELDEAMTTAASATAELARARADLAGLQMRWGRIKDLAPDGSQGAELRRIELALLEESVREAEERIKRFDWESGTRTLVAPFSGRIDRVEVTAGAIRHQGEPLLTIYDPSSLRVVAYLEPDDRGALTTGSRVQMYPQGSSEAITGVVGVVDHGWARIPPVLQRARATGQMAITLRIACAPDDRDRLAPNMVLKVIGRKR